MANYQCDPFLLKPYLPTDTEPDTYNGLHYISLVAFRFLDTRVLGIRFPFHVHFTEVNLRFYVRRKINGQWRRGVVFIKEIVPKCMITFIANTIYKEHYQTMKTSCRIHKDAGTLHIEYAWGRNNNFRCASDHVSIPIAPGSLDAFITEHYWGYAGINNNTTMEYAVEHPIWNVFPIHDFSIQCHFKKIYGASFEFLSNTKPQSVLLADGS